MIERLFYLVGKYPLNLVAHAGSLVPITLGLFFFGCLSRSYKTVLLLFTVYFVIDTCSLWLSIRDLPTYPVQNGQPLVEIGVITVIYLHCFQQNEIRKWIKLTAALCLVVVLFSYWQDTISTVGLTTQRLFVTVIVLLYFNKILRESRVKNILLHSMFWFSSGLLLYSAGTFFFSLFSSYLYSDTISNAQFDPFWQLNQILYILLCLMASFGLWVCQYDADNLF